MKNPFTSHPQSVNETYFQHMAHAARFGVSMIAGGLGCLIHAVFPFLFTKTGSRTVQHLHDCMVENRSKRTCVDAADPL